MTSTVSAAKIGTGRYAYGVLALLLLVNLVNFIDRTSASVIGQAIKVDLHLADWQLGTLTGLAFALFYSAAAVPIARLADRGNRVNVIAACLAFWSMMTGLCGAAQTFLQLLACRFGVGLGEAGCTPAAHSLISDYFQKERRATALAIYSLGIPAGVMVGAILCGWLTQHYGWRTAFMVVSVPGLVLALIVKLCVRHPPHGLRDGSGSVAIGRATPPLTEVLRDLWGQRALRHVIAAASIAGFVQYGASSFVPAYFVRQYHLGFAQVGLAIGLIGGFPAMVGALLGGLAADRLSTTDPRWQAWTPAIGMAAAAPLAIIGYLQHSWTSATIMLAVSAVFSAVYYGPVNALVQNLVSSRARASAAAVAGLISTLVGLGIGPPVVGLAIDLLAAHRFGAHGLGGFSERCVAAAVGQDRPLATLCGMTLASATRDVLIGSKVLWLWAAAHLLLAARTLRQPKDAQACDG